jgi:hypothetical protein
MRLLTIVVGLFFYISFAGAASECPNLVGHYTQYFFGTWIMKINVEQNVCETFTYTSLIPSGDKFTYTYILDGIERVESEDPSTETINYSTATSDAAGIWLEGRTTEHGKLKSYWHGSWTLDSNGWLVDYIDEYYANGTPMGPTTIKFERDQAGF